jgi:hypothetical protein
MTNRSFGWRVYYAGAALAGFVIVGGLALDAKGFAGNLFAEAAGVIASAVLALFLVDRLVAADRRARWQLVAETTTETLRSHVVRTALSLYVYLPAPRPVDADPFVMDSAGELSVGLEKLAAELRRVSELPFPPAASAADVADAVVSNTRLIAEVVLPRFMAIGAEPGVVAPIFGLDRSVGKLDYHASLADTFGLPANTLFTDMADVVDDLRKIVEALKS